MTFGERLRELRLTRKMTQEDLAKQVSLEKMSISKYETGKMLPSSTTLIALSKIFDVKVDYFFREYQAKLTAAPQFRLKNSAILTKTDQERIRRQAECAVENLMEIADICNYKPDTLTREKLREKVRHSEDVERLAQKIRTSWNLGLDPIENLMEVAETHGFTIILVEGPKQFDAAVFIDEEYGPVIALHRGAQKDRQRFTLAHELGHYFIRDDTAQSEFWNAETQANRFAAALLVPREMLLKDVGEKRENLSAGELCMLREKYGVSISALLSRMESLGIISNALKTKWNTQYPEPGRKDTVREREEPRMVRKLVYRSVAEGYISERKGKELLIEGFFGSSPEEADA